MGGYGRIWEGMGQYGTVWDCMGGYGTVWEGLGGYGTVWDGMGVVWAGMGVVWEDFWRFGSGLGVVHALRVARLFFRFPLADPEKKMRARAKKKVFPEKKLTKKLWEQGDPVGFLYGLVRKPLW